MEPEQVLERAAWLIKSQSERVKMQEELQKVFQLDWNDEAMRNKPDWVKEIKDPQPFNAMQWLVDVMAHDEPQYAIEIPEGSLPQALPQIPPLSPPMGQPMGMGAMGGLPGGMSMGGPSMGMGADSMMQGMMADTGMTPPVDDDSEARRDMGDMLEKTTQEIYRQNDQRSPTSLQRDELYAAFVNGMIVDKIADLRLSGNKWGKYKAKNRGASPFFIKSLNPAHVYFEWDEYGICEVFQRYLRPLKEVKRLYGGKVLGLANVRTNDDNANGFVEFCEYWTEDVQAMWIERVYYNGFDDANNFFAAQEPLQAGYFVQKPTQNQLGFIPYSLKVARGSSVFNRNNMVYPHLYAGHKSKLFLRQNLFFTVASTLAFMLVNPQMIHETDGDEPIELDFSSPSVIKVRKGDTITPVEMKISKDFYEVMTMLGQKVEESTVSKVIAGQNPGGVTAAAGINLLIGGGKLTVSGVQKAMGEVRAGATHKIIDYMRMYPQFAPMEDPTLEVLAGGKFNSIDPASLPERMDIQVNYQPFMPQDKALAVQTWLTPLMSKLISTDFFYEQTGVQDVVTLRRQIQQDKDRELADLQFQQQAQMQQQQEAAAMGQVVPGEEGEEPTETVGEQAVETPTANPMPEDASVAAGLNEIQNAIANPMSA
jgi:hypothetical protein